MTSLAEFEVEEHTIVPTVQFHHGRVTTYLVQIQQQNKAIQRKNRRIAKLRRIEQENISLNAELKKARNLLTMHAVEWK